MQGLRLAMVGCGDVAQRDYLPELYRLDDRAQLVAVCGRTSTRVRSVADQYAVGACYTDYERMLNHADVDAIINLTPIQLHFETTRAALEAGKHVYTEKPIAGSASEARCLLELARERGLVLVCAPSVMLFPQLRYTRELLRTEAIGPIYSASAHGHGGVPPWPGFSSDPSQYFTRGGGPALDMGVYALHALTGLLGPVHRVTAMTARAQRGFAIADGPAQGTEITIEVDDNWHMVLDFGAARLASVRANNVVQGSRAPQLELHGLEGTIAVNLLDVSAPVEVLRQSGEWQAITPPRTGRRAGPDHLLGVEHLVDCITTGKGPALSGEHALHVVEVIERAAESAASGHTMTVQSTFAISEPPATEG